MVKKKEEEVKPQDKKEKLAKAIEENKELKPKKRIRRSRAEIESEKRKSEQSLLRDDNYEVFRDVIKMMSDHDASKFKIDKVEKAEFEPLAKQYAIIANYFLPAGKPIYFVIASATFSTISMMSERKRKIDESISQNPELAPKAKQPSPTNTNPGKVRVGEKFPTQTEVKKI